MKTYLKLVNWWHLLLFFCSSGIITAYWVLKIFFMEPAKKVPFPYMQSVFFILALIAIQMLITKAVSRKVSFWAVLYSLLAAPFLLGYWPEQAGFLCLMVFPFLFFFLDENKTYTGAVLSCALVVLLYFYDFYSWVFPAVFLFGGYLVFWLNRKKWPGIIIMLLLPVIIVLFWKDAIIFSIAPYRQVELTLSFPDYLQVQVSLFVYVVLVWSMLGNKLFLLRVRSLWIVLGMTVLFIFFAITSPQLKGLTGFLLAFFFTLFYGLWFQQMLFFQTRKAAHILSWILIGINWGIFWYQSQL